MTRRLLSLALLHILLYTISGARFSTGLDSLVLTTEQTNTSLVYGDETILMMKKYGMYFHTFVYESELTRPEKRDAFHEQQRRRLGLCLRLFRFVVRDNAVAAADQ